MQNIYPLAGWPGQDGAAAPLAGEGGQVMMKMIIMIMMTIKMMTMVRLKDNQGQGVEKKKCLCL